MIRLSLTFGQFIYSRCFEMFWSFLLFSKCRWFEMIGGYSRCLEYLKDIKVSVLNIRRTSETFWKIRRTSKRFEMLGGYLRYFEVFGGYWSYFEMFGSFLRFPNGNWYFVRFMSFSQEIKTLLSNLRTFRGSWSHLKHWKRSLAFWKSVASIAASKREVHPRQQIGHSSGPERNFP